MEWHLEALTNVRAGETTKPTSSLHAGTGCLPATGSEQKSLGSSLEKAKIGSPANSASLVVNNVGSGECAREPNLYR